MANPYTPAHFPGFSGRTADTRPRSAKGSQGFTRAAKSACEAAIRYTGFRQRPRNRGGIGGCAPLPHGWRERIAIPAPREAALFAADQRPGGGTREREREGKPGRRSGQDTPPGPSMTRPFSFPTPPSRRGRGRGLCCARPLRAHRQTSLNAPSNVIQRTVKRHSLIRRHPDALHVADLASLRGAFRRSW